VDALSFAEAVTRCWLWFREACADASDPDPISGFNTELSYTPVGGTYTFGHALRDYFEWKRLRSAATHIDVILALINYHIMHRLGPIAFVDLQADDFRKLFLDVMETSPKHGNRPSSGRVKLADWDEEDLRKRKKTVNALITIIRDTLRLAWEDGKTNNDRLWRALRSFRNVDRPKMLHLNRGECRTLLKHCRPDLRQLVLGALYTGCRALELQRMRACDVGRDGYGVYVLPSKNTKPRFVFLPDEGMNYLLKLASAKPSDEKLFLRSDGHPWGQTFRSAFKVAVRAARLPGEFSFHGLRHTYASQLVQAGAPLTAIAEQLGHVNTVTVSRTYGHISPQIRESEVRQRFQVLSIQNAKDAATKSSSLSRWRKAFRTANWRTYARDRCCSYSLTKLGACHGHSRFLVGSSMQN
jgi:integrase